MSVFTKLWRNETVPYRLVARQVVASEIVAAKLVLIVIVVFIARLNTELCCLRLLLD